MDVVWKKQAENELGAIYDYIFEDSPQNADRVILKIKELVSDLPDFPLRYPKEPQANDPNVRYILIWSYKIVYAVESETILILRIFHTKQHPNKLNL